MFNVCLASWGVNIAEVESRRRPNEARDVAIYLCRAVGSKALREIGAALGIKGAAVSLAAKRIRLRLAADARLQKRVKAAKAQLIEDENTPRFDLGNPRNSPWRSRRRLRRWLR